MRALGWIVLACVVVIPVGALASSDEDSGPLFEDATAQAGLVYQQHQPPAPPDCVVGAFACDVDRMTGGGAVADVDGDGWTDLFVTRLDAPDILFRNRGDGTFEDATAQAGLAGFDLHSNGAAFADIDNDGDPDLLVTIVGNGTDGVNDRHYLFINDGAGHFSEEAVARGAAVSSNTPRLTWSATFGDYDRDGWLDLHVTEWLGTGHSRLLRNRGADAPGHFEDVTDDAGLDFAGVNGFASTFVDLDDDGWPELAVAGDFLTSRLFWNQADGTFIDGTASAGVGTDENGMGSTFGDFDGDGDLDWFVTSIRDPDDTCATGNCAWGATGNRLYRNEGGRVFSDATDAAGVRDGAWGWGAVFLDLDNDGDQDLVMTNGMELLHTDIEDPFNADPMRVWINDGTGRMEERSAELGIDDTASGKGLLAFDYDRDGDLDLFVVNNAGAPRLFRNRLHRPRGRGASAGSERARDVRTRPGRPSRATNWLRVDVRGSETNRDAIGARVRVWTDSSDGVQVREVGVASHFIGQSERVLHFGLDEAAKRVHVRVEFPVSGRVIERHRVRTRRTHVVDEGGARCGRFGVEALVLPLIPLLRRRTKRSLDLGDAPPV